MCLCLVYDCIRLSDFIARLWMSDFLAWIFYDVTAWDKLQMMSDFIPRHACNVWFQCMRLCLIFNFIAFKYLISVAMDAWFHWMGVMSDLISWFLWCNWMRCNFNQICHAWASDMHPTCNDIRKSIKQNHSISPCDNIRHHIQAMHQTSDNTLQWNWKSDILALHYLHLTSDMPCNDKYCFIWACMIMSDLIAWILMPLHDISDSKYK